MSHRTKVDRMDQTDKYCFIKESTKTKILEFGTHAIFLALLIIGSVAAAGHMDGVVTGGCIVGLSVPIILLICKSIARATCQQIKQEPAAAVVALIM